MNKHVALFVVIGLLGVALLVMPAFETTDELVTEGQRTPLPGQPDELFGQNNESADQTESDGQQLVDVTPVEATPNSVEEPADPTENEQAVPLLPSASPPVDAPVAIEPPAIVFDAETSVSPPTTTNTPQSAVGNIRDQSTTTGNSPGGIFGPAADSFNPFNQRQPTASEQFDPDTITAFVPPEIEDAPKVVFDFAEPEYNDAATFDTEPFEFVLSVEIETPEILSSNNAVVPPTVQIVETEEGPLFEPGTTPAGNIVNIETTAVPAPATPATVTTELFPSVPVAPNIPQTPFPSSVTNPFTPASNASTTIPVYDAAWQLFARASVSQADDYFETLDEWGFTGTWAAVLHHAPATWAHNYLNGGQIGSLNASGEIVLSAGYINRVQDMLDAAQRHGQKVGLVVAWQNTYLPGGETGDDPATNRVEGTLTSSNAAAYGRQMVAHFGNHPAVSQWVFGGDAGSNNTNDNIVVWRNMAAAIRSTGNTIPINYHTPTSSGPNGSGNFTHLNYAGETWLDAIAPETGHSQSAAETERELRNVRSAYNVPVWQGESRYYNITFDWIREEFRNPGATEVRDDALAARNAGVSGYVYGDAGRWNWCGFRSGDGDTTPCDPNNIAASFGAGERVVLDVFTR